MEKTIAPLTGVARAKYVRDFTCKINNNEKLIDILATVPGKVQQNNGKSRTSHNSKNTVTKKKRNFEPRLSVKLQKKNINQEFFVQRMKFLRQNIEIVNEAVNRTGQWMKDKPSVIRFSQSKFEQYKNKSFEVEKQKLNELYKADSRNVNMPMEPIPSESKLLAAEVESKSTIVVKPRVDEGQRVKINEIISQDLQQRNNNNEDVQRASHAENNPSKQSRLEKIKIESPEHAEESCKYANTDGTIQLCQNQLQNINLNSNHSNALVPSNSNNMTTGRRMCHRNRRVKRYLMKPFCAHCHDLITDVAYFSGTQQLCFECADRHYERVSRARYRDRPMGYKEFKNIGGDTIYNKT